MDTSSEPEIWSVLQTGMRSYLKVNTRMVLPREVHVKLGQRMLRAGLRMRVPFRREPRTAPAAARAVATQGTSLCTVRKYIHLSGTESPRQGATWAHLPARPPGRLRPAHVQHRGVGRCVWQAAETSVTMERLPSQVGRVRL